MKRVIQIASINDKEFLSVKTAAKRLRWSVQTVRNYLSRGIFTTYKFMGSTFLASGEVEGYLAKRKNGK